MTENFSDVTTDEAATALADSHRRDLTPLGTMPYAGQLSYLRGQQFQLLAYQDGAFSPGVAAIWRDHTGVNVLASSTRAEADAADPHLAEAFQRARWRSILPPR